MLTLSELTPAKIDDFLSLRLPDEETKKLLIDLAPHKVNEKIFYAFLDALRKRVVPLSPVFTPFMDCCGTGGSGLPHFNTSTTVAFVLAAGGMPVIKFGNRAMSSQSGSFDLLEQLGLTSHIPPAAIEEILNAAQVIFLYAPDFYPDLAQFTALRRSLKTKTIFNYMGPLLHPLKPRYRLLGVSNPRMQGLMAETLANEGQIDKAWLVHAESGLDEIAPHCQTDILEVQNEDIRVLYYMPEFNKSDANMQLEHSPNQNLSIFQSIVSGSDTNSPYFQMVCLNAGAGFHIAGLTTTLREGIIYAQELIAKKKVLEVVENCRSAYDRHIK